MHTNAQTPLKPDSQALLMKAKPLLLLNFRCAPSESGEGNRVSYHFRSGQALASCFVGSPSSRPLSAYRLGFDLVPDTLEAKQYICPAINSQTILSQGTALPSGGFSCEQTTYAYC